MTVRSNENSKVEEYDLASILGIKPKKLAGFLLKRPGDKVKKGDLVARRGGLKRRFFISPIEGEITSLTEGGVLRICCEVSSFPKVAAQPIKEENRGGVSVSRGFGSKGKGILFYFDNGKTIFDLDDDLEEKIIAFSGDLSLGLWCKALSLGAKGVICKCLPEGDFEIKLEKLMCFGATDGDNGVPLVVVEDKDGHWESLKKHQGKLVELDGAAKLLLLIK